MGRTRQSKRNISQKASHQKTSPKPNPDSHPYTTSYARKYLPDTIPDDAPIPLTEAKMIEEIKKGMIRLNPPTIVFIQHRNIFLSLSSESQEAAKRGTQD